MTWLGETFKGKIWFTIGESKPSWQMPPRPRTTNTLLLKKISGRYYCTFQLCEIMT